MTRGSFHRPNRSAEPAAPGHCRHAVSGDRHYLTDRPRGRIFFAPLDVIPSRFDVVEPDLLCVSHDREGELLRDYVHGAPDLVVEVTSKSTRKRDETIKRHLYERFGVSEYWVVNPELDLVRVCRRMNDRYDRPVELSRKAGDVLTTPLFPGLEIPLARIFRR